MGFLAAAVVRTCLETRIYLHLSREIAAMELDTAIAKLRNEIIAKMKEREASTDDTRLSCQAWRNICTRGIYM